MNSKKTVQAVFCLLITACLLMTACPSGGGGSVALKGITLVPPRMTLQEGRTGQLIPSFNPAKATNKKVTYSLRENNGSVEVDSVTGLVTAVAEGQDVVIVTSDSNKDITAECLVTVRGKVAVDAIHLNIKTLNMVVGDVESLIYVTEPFNATINTVSWGTSNPAAAIVVNGVVRATGVGTATITVTSNDIAKGNITDTCFVDVKAAASGKRVTGISLSANVLEFTLEQGSSSETLIAEILPEDAEDQTVTWLSSNTTVATVNSSTGEVTPVSQGTALIIVTTQDGGKVALCIVNVHPAQPEGEITGVTLDKDEMTLVAGKTGSLTAAVKPEGAANPFVMWESSNPNVATVEYSGEFDATVTAIAEGTAIITVTTDEGGYTAACIVRVEAAPLPPSNIAVTGVTIDGLTHDSEFEGDNKNLKIGVNEKITLQYTVSPANATNKTVTWSSSDTSKVTVNSEGEVTGVAASAIAYDLKITVITLDGNKTDSCDVWVSVIPVTALTITPIPPNNQLDNYLTWQFTVEVVPANASDKRITWTSGNPARGTIDENTGLFTAVSPGTYPGANSTTTITVRSVAYYAIVATVPVEVMAVETTGITLSVTNDEGPFGQGLTGLVVPASGSATVTAFVEPWNATNRTITWNKGVNNPAVIGGFEPSTTQSGASTTIVAASTAGTTSFYASQGALIRSEEIDFNIRTFPATQQVSTITLNINSIELAVNNTATLVPTVLPATATDPRFRWVSSRPAIAEVNATTGVITAKAPGTATITVNSVNGKSTSGTVNVYAPGPRIPLTGISIPATYSQPDNTTMLLPFTLTPANATSPGMRWTSSDTSVATVTNEGRLTSLKPGTTTLSVLTTEGAKTATCVVTVTRVPVTGITLNRNTRIELNSQGPRGASAEPAGTYTLISTLVPSNATDKSVTWTSSNTAVATVSASGLVTAVGVGTATITATTNSTDGARTATCPVFVWLFRQVRINAGEFLMGSPLDEPNRHSDEMQHRVNITQGFYMGQYVVTSDNYNKVVGTRPSGSTGNQPVTNVNWYEAILFCNKLSELEGLTPAYRINGTTNTSAWGAVPWAHLTDALWDAATIVAGSTGYRLPTEAQWEYACRAGTTTAYNFGNTWDSSYGVTFTGSLANVGTKMPNAWQLYDMHGNVWEWCWDWYGAAYYEESPRNDPTGPASGYVRVRRGGDYYTYTMYDRSAYRFDISNDSPPVGVRGMGFRVVRP